MNFKEVKTLARDYVCAMLEFNELNSEYGRISANRPHEYMALETEADYNAFGEARKIYAMVERGAHKKLKGAQKKVLEIEEPLKEFFRQDGHGKVTVIVSVNGNKYAVSYYDEAGYIDYIMTKKGE